MQAAWPDDGSISIVWETRLTHLPIILILDGCFHSRRYYVKEYAHNLATHAGVYKYRLVPKVTEHSLKAFRMFIFR